MRRKQNGPALVLAGAAVLVSVMLTACSRESATVAATAPGGTGTAAGAAPAAAGLAYEAHVPAGGVMPPGVQLHNPHAGDAAVAKSGAMLFNAMNCDGCHGGDATGWVGPSLADGRWRYGGADEEVFASIFYGRPKGMPAFGGALGPEGVWTLVTYLKSLPVPADEATESWVTP